MSELVDYCPLYINQTEEFTASDKFVSKPCIDIDGVNDHLSEEPYIQEGLAKELVDYCPLYLNQTEEFTASDKFVSKPCIDIDGVNDHLSEEPYVPEGLAKVLAETAKNVVWQDNIFVFSETLLDVIDIPFKYLILTSMLTHPVAASVALALNYIDGQYKLVDVLRGQGFKISEFNAFVINTTQKLVVSTSIIGLQFPTLKNLCFFSEVFLGNNFFQTITGEFVLRTVITPMVSSNTKDIMNSLMNYNSIKEAKQIAYPNTKEQSTQSLGGLVKFSSQNILGNVLDDKLLSDKQLINFIADMAVLNFKQFFTHEWESVFNGTNDEIVSLNSKQPPEEKPSSVRIKDELDIVSFKWFFCVLYFPNYKDDIMDAAAMKGCSEVIKLYKYNWI